MIVDIKDEALLQKDLGFIIIYDKLKKLDFVSIPEERMTIKKMATLLSAALICIMIAGCSVETTANEEPSAALTATPTPKAGIEAVFDKPVALAIVSSGDETASALFFEAAAREAKSLGVTVTTNAAGSDFNAVLAEAAQDADAVVVFLPQEIKDIASLDVPGKPTAVFETKKSSVPESVSHFYYESDGELDAALDAALTYPPHDTPVRLILLFESAESPAYAAYQQLYDEGKIFPKEIYIASEEELEVGEWLTEKLNSYVEGMLDAVFAEDMTLAATAGDALFALDRTDMEVFCPGVSADVVSRMQSHPDVFAQAVGHNDALAGVLCVRAALNMLHGEKAIVHTFKPMLINAADLNDEAATAMITIDSEQAALFNASWMDMLRDNYSATTNASDTQ